MSSFQWERLRNWKLWLMSAWNIFVILRRAYQTWFLLLWLSLHTEIGIRVCWFHFAQLPCFLISFAPMICAPSFASFKWKASSFSSWSACYEMTSSYTVCFKDSVPYLTAILQLLPYLELKAFFQDFPESRNLARLASVLRILKLNPSSFPPIPNSSKLLQWSGQKCFGRHFVGLRC